MRKFWQVIAAVMLAMGGWVGVSAVTPGTASAWNCPSAYSYYPVGGGVYLGGAASFNCQSGTYNWIRVLVQCSGSGAWHYGGWVTAWNTSYFKCWPGTYSNGISYQLST